MPRPIARVAVTGIGVVSALGEGAAPSFARLVAGERGVGPVTLFDVEGLRSGVAATLPDFRVPHGLSRTDALALAAAREALAGAGLARGGARLGLALGGTTGSMLETERELAERLRGGEAPRVDRLLSHPLSRTVEVLETELGGFARSATVCSACSSGAVAVVLGAHWVLAGEADAVLAGGADALCRMTFAGFNALGAVDPAPCRPFDRGRRGLTLGEGAAFLVLESEERARARSAPVLAWLSGWAVGAEAHHITHPEPSGARAARLIEDALVAAGLAPDAVDFVNAHGTATEHNDAMEAEALRRVFGARRADVRVASNKGQIGHALGAAGAVEAAFTVLALGSGVVPPTAGLVDPDAPDLGHVRGASERRPLRAAISNSFGFGGMDAVLVFEARDASARDGRALASELVITGASALAAGLLAGAACAELAERAPSVAPLPGDPLATLSPERSRRFDRATAFTVLAVEAALAGLGLAGADVGLVLGSAYGPVERSMRFLDSLLGRGLRAAAPAEFPHLVQSAGAGNASIYLGLEGPVLATIDGALSGESALARAASLVELGVARAVVAGAVETHDSVVAELDPAPPSGVKAPRSEGGGFVVLETLEHARRRGVTPLARLAAHSEQRGAARLEGAAFGAPSDPASARVLLDAEGGAWSEVLAASAWASVPRLALRERLGHHEALGGVALAVGAALVAGGARDVLVLSGGATARYATRLCALEPAA